MKKLLKILAKFILLIVLLAGVLFIASKLLEEKIVQKAVGVINNQIEVPVYVESIQFSLLKQFPSASLQLNNVTLLSAKSFDQSHFSESYADTLLYFKELYLSVNLLALSKSKLDITKAYAKKGHVNFLVDKNGKENFNIFTKKPIRTASDSSTKNMVFMLNQIQLKQVDVRFINKFKNTGIGIYAPNYAVKGQFYKKNYSASSKGKLLLNFFEQGNIELKLSNPAAIQMDLSVNNKTIIIEQGSIVTNAFNLSTKGTISLGTPTKLDLSITGTSNELKQLLETTNLSYLDDFDATGQLGVSAIVKGYIDNRQSPTVMANFKLVQGSVKDKKTNLKFDNIAIEGSYSNGEQNNLTTSSLALNHFELSSDSSSIKGSLQIKNFIKPLLNTTVETNLDLKTLNTFFKDKNISIGGYLKGSFSSNGLVDFKRKWYENLDACNKIGSFGLTDGTFSSKVPQFKVADASGSISLDNQNITVNELIARVQNSNVRGKAEISSYLKIISDSTSSINIRSTIDVDQISYDDYKHLFQDTSKAGRNYNVWCKFKSDRAIYNKLIADKASGDLSYLNDKLNVSNLHFNALEGSFSGQLNYNPNGTGAYVFQTTAVTKKVNIQTLFETFNNFNQKYILSKNIGGYLSSNFDLEMLFRKGEVDTSSIELLGHVLIQEGKLLNFEPISEAAKFSEIDELKHIEFSTLENDILISNSTIHIPKMNITSNAFDLSCSGQHKFSGDYEYNLRINMSDFVGGKSKRLSKQQSEFGYIEDDGLGKRTLYLVATNTNGKSKVKLDKAAIRRNLKSDLGDEKKELKKVLHDEFGWFKKDSTLQKVQETEKGKDFIIEWDEE